MNALIDSFPVAITIDGREYAINYDYRTCLRIVLAFEDSELTPAEKNLLLLEQLYIEQPENTGKALEMAVKFLNCGDLPDASGDSGPRLYSFDKDSKYIYSAVHYSHGIDLNQCPDLHWWKFCYLFFDLRDDSFFNRLIYLRSRKNSGKLTQDERQLYYSMKDIVDLPEVLSHEEQQVVDDFMARLNGG